MKLPILKESDGKRMMMTSNTSGRKGLTCERRETSLVGGHPIRGVQFKRSNMDLGSGDTSDFYPPTITKTHVSESASTPPPPPPPTPPGGNALSSSTESINGKLDDEKSNADIYFKGKVNQDAESKGATLAVVEDSKGPSFTANESNPTVPTPTEPSKTSTLRLSDRTRSESEDDIEKMEEPEQDGTLIGHKTLYKTAATTENSPHSEKIDKNGNRSDLDQNEADNDCVVQCLYYTIQCCECVIF